MRLHLPLSPRRGEVAAALVGMALIDHTLWLAA